VNTPLAWVLFNLAVLLLLAMDLGLFHRRARAVSLGEAAAWSAFWIAASVGFGAWLWRHYGPTPGLEFFTGYVIEKSLSLDNLFVFALLFRYFVVEPRHQYRVLYWGILGALMMRAALIGAGVALVRQFHWVLYFFGAFLVFAGIRMLRQKDHFHLEENRVLRWARKYLPLTDGYVGQRFFVRREGLWLATPLLLVLLVMETADLTFALDSIPAVFSITRDPFIVYTSNVCAILGLRALYFLLAGVVMRLRYLDTGLSLLLLFVGGKMLVEPWMKIPTHVALVVVAIVLAASILLSLAAPGMEKEAPPKKPGAKRAPEGEVPETAGLIAQLADEDPARRHAAAAHLHRRGSVLGDAAVASWRGDTELGKLIMDHATVGIAVRPETFEKIHAAAGKPILADVPPDQDAREFELHAGPAHLDILTTRDPGAAGAIARFLEKFGEGVQQVEYVTPDVDRATALLRERLSVQPIYPATRPGADGTRVNFFLAQAPHGKKVLIELVELPQDG
jgi:tellurite resistance protein TerC